MSGKQRVRENERAFTAGLIDKTQLLQFRESICWNSTKINEQNSAVEESIKSHWFNYLSALSADAINEQRLKNQHVCIKL